eukprot:3905031-Prymnesium_polylepis.1
MAQGDPLTAPCPTIGVIDWQLVRDEVWQTFKRFDRDNSGGLCVDQLRDALSYLGRDTESLYACKLLQKYDENQSGQLELEQFNALVAALVPQKIWRVFHEFDANGNGVLEVNELRAALISLGRDIESPAAT